MLIEPEYPGMDEHFRYDVDEFYVFGKRPVLPNGDLGPVEVRVSFYMDGLCWYELENSPIWQSVSDHVRGHQTARTHQQLPGLEWESASGAYSNQSAQRSRRRTAFSGGFRCAFSGIRNLFQRLCKGKSV